MTKTTSPQLIISGQKVKMRPSPILALAFAAVSYALPRLANSRGSEDTVQRVEDKELAECRPQDLQACKAKRELRNQGDCAIPFFPCHVCDILPHLPRCDDSPMSEEVCDVCWEECKALGDPDCM